MQTPSELGLVFAGVYVLRSRGAPARAFGHAPLAAVNNDGVQTECLVAIRQYTVSVRQLSPIRRGSHDGVEERHACVMLSVQRVLPRGEIAVDLRLQALVHGAIGEDEVEEVGERDGGRVCARDHGEHAVRDRLRERWRDRVCPVFIVL